MKKILNQIVFVYLVTTITAKAQKFTIEIDGEKSLISKSENIKLSVKPDKTIKLKVDAKKYKLILNGVLTNIEIDSNLKEVEMDFDKDNFLNFDKLNNFTIKIIKPETKNKDDIQSELPSVETVFEDFLGEDYNINDNGEIILENNKNTKFNGSKYIHLFFDEFGNSILTSIPQGEAYKEYVIHVLYRQTSANQFKFSINQTKGFFNNRLFLDNSGSFRSDKDSEKPSPVFSTWMHSELKLRPSNDENIEFTIRKTDVIASKSEDVITKSIRIEKRFHGSFDIGLLNTNLANPTFELVDSPSKTGEKVVKKSNDGNYGTVTAMFTYYFSPIRALRYLVNPKSIDKKTLKGRSYYNDHEWYERLYPALGVSISQSAFKNLFLGVNFEFARGGNFFFGRHFGEINTFNSDSNFKFGDTSITSASFELKKDKSWESDWCYGLKLDISIIKELFGSVPK
jgi:hypothetical protein